MFGSLNDFYQGKNPFTGFSEEEARMGKEERDAYLNAILDDLEQNCEVAYSRQDDGLVHPVIRRK